MTVQQSPLYFLNSWIYSCVSLGHLILLDTREDKYYFIDRDEIHNLPFNWHPAFLNETRPSSDSSSAGLPSNTIDDLLKNNIITADHTTGKFFAPCLIDEPCTPFEHIECDDWPKVHWHHYLFAFTASILAFLILKFVSLNTTIRVIRKRKTENITVPLGDLLQLARIYRLLRPFLIQSRICLYDSLSFYIFASFYDATPDIVFGVIAEPFEAHCWAQKNGLILNDVPHNIRVYQPIMSL